MTTLNSKLKISGAGLMSGVETSLVISPSDVIGIRFHIGGAVINADLSNVISTEHCVVLGDVPSVKKGVAPDKVARIGLIEHFMAACAICDIDSLDVEIQGGFEMPILDGSAKVWVEKFNEIGTTATKGQEFEHKISLSRPINYIKNNSAIILTPQDAPTTITYAVNFNHPELQNRWVSTEISNLTEIIEARTFGYLKDLETFQKMGFSKGVTVENTVGLTQNGYTTELRSEFEPVKHKILDIIGDLYLTGVNPLKLNANIFVKEAGHTLHIEAAKLLKEQI